MISIVFCAALLMGGSASGANSPSEKLLRGLPIAFGLPRVVALNANLSRTLVVESVFQATRLSGGGMVGRIVNTGTLALGPSGFQYQPHPADRLILRLGEQTHGFVVKQAQGNMAATTGAAWLLSPHRLHYVHVLHGAAEADISYYFDGYRFEAGIKGWNMFNGARYTIDLTSSGHSASVRDYHGQQVQTEYDLKGKLQGDGFGVDVDERHQFNMAAATNMRMPHHMRGSASRFNGTLRNLLHMDGDVYKFENVRIVTDVKGRGGEGSAGVVDVGGEILLNGQPFGRCVLQAGRVIAVTETGRITLDLPIAAERR